MSKAYGTIRQAVAVICLFLVMFGDYFWRDMAFALLIGNATYNVIYAHYQFRLLENGDPRVDPKVVKAIHDNGNVPIIWAIWANVLIFSLYIFPTLVAMRFGPWWMSYPIFCFTLFALMWNATFGKKELEKMKTELK